MAIVQNLYTGNGSTVLFPFSFPYLEEDHIFVSLNGTLTTAFTFPNASTVQFNTAPAVGVAIRIFRETPLDQPEAVFAGGSTIRASDLNRNNDQLLYVAQESNFEAESATTTANTALVNSTTAISTANGAVSTANTASANASAAVSTANTANSNASAAVSTANTASTNASNAVTTANTASSNASAAVSTANTALSTANAATATANTASATATTASTNASAAVTTANTATTTAGNAVTTANNAVTTANSAVTTAGNAVTTANNTVTTANNAVTTANTAVSTANAAASAVANAILYDTVANVAAIPATPANNDAVEVVNSTGIQSFTPLNGIPGGFVGSSGLSVRIVFTAAGNTWNWIQYFPNDPESRYLKLSGGTVTGEILIGSAGSLVFEGATDDAFETTLAVADATADRTLTLPNVTGTLVSTGDTGTVTSTMLLDGTIVNADINASAAIALSKFATGALPSGITVASANIVDGTIVNADINASAAIVDTKLATISTAGKVSNSATTAASANTASAIVARDASGNFAAGDITISDKIIHDGDTNTAIRFPAADTFTVETGGVERVEFGNTEVVFNDVGANVDFRIEGDTRPNLFKIDAGLDQVQVENLNGGPLAGFRNAIINGNFDIWQRGTSFPSPAGQSFLADRWRVVFNGGGTRTLSRQPFTLGQVANEPTYFLKWNQTVAGSAQTTNDLRQKIESVRSFAGRQVTLSFYAKAQSAGPVALPTVGLSQNFGSGGSPSTEVYTQAAASVALTASWQRFSYTITLPSITGKTLGSGNNDALDLVIRMPLNATFNIHISQVQVEPGPVATPFERRPIGTELALCQRYYHLLRQNMFSSGNASIARVHVQFPTSMRTTPTVSLTTLTGGALDWACPEFAQFYKGGAGVSIEVVPPTTFTAEL